MSSRSTNVTCPGALERSCSRALFLIVGIANTASVQYTYDKGNPSSVQRTNNGKTQTYGFTYDCFGNMLTAKVGSRTLTTNVYNNSFDQLVQQAYGNGAVVSYTYDKLGRTKTATYDDGRVHNGTVIRHITERDNWKKCKQKS